jgi:hypothetical protein
MSIDKAFILRGEARQKSIEDRQRLGKMLGAAALAVTIPMAVIGGGYALHSIVGSVQEQVRQEMNNLDLSYYQE